MKKIQSEDLAPGNAIIEAYIQYIFMYISLAVVVNAGWLTNQNQYFPSQMYPQRENKSIALIRLVNYEGKKNIKY